jgi:hypothetical protein
MATTLQQTSRKIGQLGRTVAALLIAGVFRSRPFAEVEQDLRNKPLRQQATITLGVLGLLFGLSVCAAQFGWIGLLAFWLAIVVLVN